jgi:hypothetical protein
MPVFMKMDGIDGDIGRGSSAGRPVSMVPRGQAVIAITAASIGRRHHAGD